MSPASEPTRSPRRLLIPSRRMLALWGLVLGIALLASIWPTLRWIWLGALALTLVGLAIDAWQLWTLALPDVSRKHARALALGVDSDISLMIDNAGPHALQLTVCDHTPQHTEVHGMPQQLTLPAQRKAELRYRLRPVQRGELAFGPVELRVSSPLGLWQLRCAAAEPGRVRVYPNFTALARYALLATDHRLSQLGVLRRRRRGEGMDFHQMREYREGDTPRQIDWKASARMRRLVSREYRDERDQQILLLLDCGRRMHARDGELSHLDHALNAALLLAHVALRQGDAVGMLTFGGSERYVPPRKSQLSLNALLAGVYDLQATLHQPDYYQAAVRLMQLQRKRSLVVLISNLRDEDDDTLLPAISLLRQRHLVVLASLRERILDDALMAPVDSLDHALTHAATAQYLEQRRRSFARLEQSRIPCLDVEPQALPIALVNRYTDLKRRGAI